MDVDVNIKRGKNRKRKRHSKIKRREQARLEVRFAKRRKIVSMPVERNNASTLKTRDKTGNTMQANTFWENYEAAHEWQRRHSVEWWKARCVALEHENSVLRDKIREMASDSDRRVSGGRTRTGQTRRRVSLEREEEPENSENDNLEFQVDEDMMKFFEQSMRHKIELKEKRDVESALEKAEREEGQNVPIQGGAAWMQAKTDRAKLLYGDSSPRILAMETALQATIDRHKDRAKPQYWPNIPLNL